MNPPRKGTSPPRGWTKDSQRGTNPPKGGTKASWRGTNPSRTGTSPSCWKMPATHRENFAPSDPTRAPPKQRQRSHSRSRDLSTRWKQFPTAGGGAMAATLSRGKRIRQGKSGGGGFFSAAHAKCNYSYFFSSPSNSGGKLPHCSRPRTNMTRIVKPPEYLPDSNSTCQSTKSETG